MPRYVRQAWSADCDRCDLAYDDKYGRFEADELEELIAELIDHGWVYADNGKTVLCWECKENSGGA